MHDGSTMDWHLPSLSLGWGPLFLSQAPSPSVGTDNETHSPILGTQSSRPGAHAVHHVPVPAVSPSDFQRAAAPRPHPVQGQNGEEG